MGQAGFRRFPPVFTLSPKGSATLKPPLPEGEGVADLSAEALAKAEGDG
jgi:hypothetical protein